MIMAGRGRRLGDFGDHTKKVGNPSTVPDDLTIDMPTLLSKINEIDVNDVNPTTLNCIRTIFEKLCPSDETMNGVLSDLHAKSLCDEHFGEKFVVAVTQGLLIGSDRLNVRNKFLSLIQSDFESRETLAQSEPKKFLNVVMVLGDAFRRIKIGDAPITVMGEALLTCLDLLLKGEAEQLKTLTKQVVLNGKLLEEKTLCEKYDQLKVKLRNTLISRDLSSTCRCWILLAVDFVTNDIRPLTGVLKDFYVCNLGEEYTRLESLVEVMQPKLNNSSNFINEGTRSGLQKGFDKSPNKTEGGKQDFTKKFSNLNIKTDLGGFKGKKEKVVSPQGKSTNKASHWKSVGKGSRTSEHDDRFEKDEHFYGVQMPRGPKPENQRKSSNEGKTNKDSSDGPKSPTGLSGAAESAAQGVTSPE